MTITTAPSQSKKVKPIIVQKVKAAKGAKAQGKGRPRQGEALVEEKA